MLSYVLTSRDGKIEGAREIEHWMRREVDCRDKRVSCCYTSISEVFIEKIIKYHDGLARIVQLPNLLFPDALL